MTNYKFLLEKIAFHALSCGRDPASIALIPISKTYSLELMKRLYEEGCRSFGEGRMEEAIEKKASFPEDCHWHLVGSLQRKKVAKAMGHFKLIHSVDSWELAEKISEESVKLGLTTSILIQVNTSGELSKRGLSPENWHSLLESLDQLSALKIEGLMTMAPLTNDEEWIRSSFRTLYECRERWKDKLKNPALFHHLSMGMSKDYEIAIEEGATLLRLGSALADDFIPLA